MEDLLDQFAEEPADGQSERQGRQVFAGFDGIDGLA
jgi:hypothetical protein